jgi:AraC-like DNA-binding protein
MHPRTLQRRLAEENTTFLDLVDDVRRNAARQYLTMTDLSMTQVAGLLGLSEQSALTRCTRRWWGATPRQVRRNPDLVRDGVAQG